MYCHNQYLSYLKENSQKARNCIHLWDVSLALVFHGKHHSTLSDLPHYKILNLTSYSLYKLYYWTLDLKLVFSINNSAWITCCQDTHRIPANLFKILQYSNLLWEEFLSPKGMHSEVRIKRRRSPLENSFAPTKSLHFPFYWLWLYLSTSYLKDTGSSSIWLVNKTKDFVSLGTYSPI